MIVPNEKDGGKFHLNVCDYLNQYGEKIPASCSGYYENVFIDNFFF